MYDSDNSTFSDTIEQHNNCTGYESDTPYSSRNSSFTVQDQDITASNSQPGSSVHITGPSVPKT